MPPKNKEKTLEESLKDPVYVNYNLLLKLEEIKKLLLTIILEKSKQKKVIKEEEKEGVFKGK